MSEDLLVDGYDYNPHTCVVEVPYNDYWDMKDRIINLKKENEYLQTQLQQKENIIKELDKVIIEFKKQIEEERKNCRKIIGNFVDKVKELKGSDK